ncbi:hypothetical protein [Brevundimonas sp.]|uniref:hypothetical protein n=1 Tax=Brevundimonas sp. TaxID=1871086 RepID=UPI0028AF66AF|nr:hypothetical protein [Brevundimonas sp.]
MDSRLSSNFTYGPKEAFAPAILPWAPLVLLRSGYLPAWMFAFALAATWCLFVTWRASRMIRAGEIKSARDYDRRAKFDLPPEYAASESLLAHQRRKRKAQR